MLSASEPVQQGNDVGDCDDAPDRQQRVSIAIPSSKSECCAYEQQPRGDAAQDPPCRKRLFSDEPPQHQRAGGKIGQFSERLNKEGPPPWFQS
jgi:hypothetical protein